MTPRSRGAFSLLEMVIATAIVAGAAGLLLDLAGVGWQHATSAEDLAAAQRIGQNLLCEFLVGARPVQAAEQLPVDGEPGWLYSLAIDRIESPMQSPNLAALRLAVFQQSDAEQPRALFTLTRWIRDTEPRVGQPLAPPETSEGRSAFSAAREEPWPVTRRSGFTLLEVLVATMMLATLLACLWGLLGTFTRLFEQGPVKVDQAQLASALAAQLGDDLHHALEDSPAPDAGGPLALPAGSAAVRRFGLVGTANSLRLDVLQPLPDDKLPKSTEGVAAGVADADAPRVPELRTIVYEFTPPPTPDGADLAQPPAESATELQTLETSFATARPGLIRREMDFETPTQQSSQTLRDRAAAGDVPTSPTETEGDTFDAATSTDLFAFRPDDDSESWFPEIVGLTFRYFDGFAWSDSWNSLQRKSLPVAVEVTLQTQLPESAQAPPAAATDAADTVTTDTSDTAADANLQADATAEPSIPTFRYVIYLPAARMASHLPKPPALVPAMPDWAVPPPPVDVPPPAPPTYAPPADLPPAGLPRGGAATPRPDGWMRVGS